MPFKRIIPCLDVRGGRVVKGRQFEALKDAGDPVEQARRYNAEGADEICFLDITATAEGRGLLLDLIEKTADEVFMPITVGGGIKNLEDIRALLNAGADKVTVNSAAVENPRLISDAATRFGCQCIVIAIDAKRRLNQAQPQWEVFTHSGRTAAGRDAVEWAREVERLGAGEVIVTSIDRDGTRLGYDLELTRSIAGSVRIPLVASGGVGTLEHLCAGISQGQADAVLAASIFHYGEHSIPEVKAYMRQQGISVRMT